MNPMSPMNQTPQTQIAQLLEQGLFHHRRGEFAPAMERYVEVLKRDPQNADALYYSAVIACAEGQYREGIDLARRSLTFRGRQARVHNLIGKALAEMNELKDALAAFDEALACDIKFAEAFTNRGNMLCDLGRYTEGLSSYDRALELEPIAANWLNRGTALEGLDRVDEAIESYDRAIALEPGVPLTYINRSHALLSAGRNEEALATAERAVEVGPSVPYAHLAKAQAQLALGQKEAALVAAERAIAVAPQLAKAHKARAAILDALGRAEEAKASREQAAGLA